MAEENKDTQIPAAPEGTPADATQNGSANQPTNQDSAVRKYAGKYESPEELERAYQEASSKIGQKSYAEKIGDKVISATGYSTKDLEEAGYSPDDIASAIVAYQQTGKQQAMPAATVDPAITIKKAVESSKVDNLQFELELDRYLRKNPEAEEFTDFVTKMKKHPDYRDKSVAEIFEDVKPILKKAREVVEKTNVQKEQASMSISQSSAPEPKQDEAAANRYRQTGRSEDATEYIFQRLFKKGNKE